MHRREGESQSKRKEAGSQIITALMSACQRAIDKQHTHVTFSEFIQLTDDNMNDQDTRKRTRINRAAKEGHHIVVDEFL